MERVLCFLQLAEVDYVIFSCSVQIEGHTEGGASYWHSIYNYVDPTAIKLHGRDSQQATAAILANGLE